MSLLGITYHIKQPHILVVTTVCDVITTMCDVIYTVYDVITMKVVLSQVIYTVGVVIRRWKPLVNICS